MGATGSKWRSNTNAITNIHPQWFLCLINFNIMNPLPVIIPKKDKQSLADTSAVKVSPVKVPTGAKQIGNYILGKTIGTGSFGKVHLGLHIPTGERVAVKILEKLKLTTKDLERVHRQIDILTKILHPSLIQLYEIIETEKSLLFVTEYMANGELFNYILERKKLSEKEACKIFHQIVEGLEYMHKIGIAHRDLKPQNILIDYDGRVKIIDFGLSNTYEPNQKLKTECGSPCYAAPEMIEGKHKYDPLMIDIWSAGITLFAMICGYLPFCDPEIPKLYKKILSGTFKFPTWISEEAQDLISMMLKTNPAKRATLMDIKQHKWFLSNQYRNLKGIDVRYQRIPLDAGILKHIKSMNSKIGSLEDLLYNNKKTKQTAYYYILAKKLTRQGCSLPSFFGNQAFDEGLLKPLALSEEDSAQTTVVEGISAIEVQSVNEEKPPISSSSLPAYNLKSVEFKIILKDFLDDKPSLQKDALIPLKKQIFYENMENQKKKQSLRIIDNRSQRAKTLLTMKNQNKRSLETQSVMKDAKNKRNIIEMIQNLKNPGKGSPKTQIQKRKRIELPVINNSANLEKINISI